MSHAATNTSSRGLAAEVGTDAGQALAWISWLRVTAISGVVLIHVAGLTAIADDARSTPVGRLGIALDFGSRWCVPAFVMLSGALLLDPERFRGGRPFLRRRALRLVPPLVFWHCIYLGFVVAFTDVRLTPLRLVELVLTGRLWTALYFFWIVLGLAVITPVLVPWIASASRTAQLWVSTGALSLPVLTVITVPLRSDLAWGSELGWVHTPWNWWIPYLGYYLLGFALKDVVLRGWRLGLAAAGAMTLGALLYWQWEKSTGPAGVIERFMPAEAYQSPVVVGLTICVYLTARALIRPGGLLRALSNLTAARVGRTLGDVTLGVFAVHLLVLEALLRAPYLGGKPAASTVPELLARCVVVLLVSYAFALSARRVPGLRRVV